MRVIPEARGKTQIEHHAQGGPGQPPNSKPASSPLSTLTMYLIIFVHIVRNTKLFGSSLTKDQQNVALTGRLVAPSQMTHYHLTRLQLVLVLRGLSL